jgi:hypothetical protein
VTAATGVFKPDGGFTRDTGNGALLVTQVGTTSVTSFGAVGDGTTNDATAIQTALTAAAGKVLLIPPGTYNVPSALTLPAGGVTILAYGATFTRTTNNAAWFTGGGTLSTIAASGGVLTSNATAGATTLAVTDASTIAAGDRLLLRSTLTFPSATAAYGEQVRVLSKATNTLTLYGPIMETYNTANAAIVDKVNHMSNVVIEGLTMQGVTASGGYGAMNFDYLLNPRFRNLTFKNLDGPALQLNAAWGARGYGIDGFDLTDDPGNGRYGYLLNIAGASQDCVFDTGRSERVRHHFTTTNGTTGGVPHNITVVGCHGAYATTTDFDTHEEGRHIFFVGCESRGSQGAFKMRCPDCVLTGPVASGFLSDGINISSTSLRTQVNTPRVTDNRGSSYSMQISADDVVVSGGLVDNQNTGTSHCVFINAAAKTAVLGTRLRNPAGGTGTCLVISGSPTGHIIDVACEDAAKGVDVGSSTPTSIKIRPRNLSSHFIDGSTFTGALAQAITPGASPYVWTNSQGIEVDLQISGGTVSDLRRSNDGSSFTFVPGTSGTFRVAPGAAMKVTYSVAPTMNFIPVRA